MSACRIVGCGTSTIVARCGATDKGCVDGAVPRGASAKLCASPASCYKRRRTSLCKGGAEMDLGKGTLAGLARLRDYKSRRLSSCDRTGGNLDCLIMAPGACVELGR